MDYIKIEILLEKYLEGNSSVQEENALRHFFNESEDIPEKLLYAKEMFRYFSDEKSTEYTKEFKSKKPSRVFNIYTLSGLAASFLLAMFFIFTNYNGEEKVIYAYINGEPITDINIAKSQAKLILYDASQKLNTGTEYMNRVGDLLNPESLIKK